MNLVQIDFPTLVADTNAGKYQASLAGWSGRIDPDGNTYNMWHTGSPNNLYSNPQVDDLLDKATGRRAIRRSGKTSISRRRRSPWTTRRWSTISSRSRSC